MSDAGLLILLSAFLGVSAVLYIGYKRYKAQQVGLQFVDSEASIELEELEAINTEKANMHQDAIDLLSQYKQMHDLPDGPEKQVEFIYCRKNIHEFDEKYKGVLSN